MESVEGPEKLARYSFIGFNPRLLIEAKDGRVRILGEEEGEEATFEGEGVLDLIHRVLGTQGSPGGSLVGGAVGYISYDAVRYWERIPKIAVDDLGFPDLEMGIFDDGIAFDHRGGGAYYYYRSLNRLDQLGAIVGEGSPDPRGSDGLSYTEPRVNVSKERFEEGVAKAKEYVASGDVLQVVLSKRYELRFKGELTGFYGALRRINQSPYMYYLKMGDRQVIGSSPEMLVRVDGRTVETFPIAGTRPRVEDPLENAALTRELLSDPKERAEHVMLVDLARNDIGKVSAFGSVEVPESMVVHQYSHVQHIVSRVVGRLREGLDGFDAFKAVFPAGTVSGAPKVRAMEIIEECEPFRRGPYAGAVGYFSFNGNADFAITIRTLVAFKDRAYIQVGAGIVADSVPEREWFETEHKARALMKALEASSGGGVVA